MTKNVVCPGEWCFQLSLANDWVAVQRVSSKVTHYIHKQNIVKKVSGSIINVLLVWIGYSGEIESVLDRNRFV